MTSLILVFLILTTGCATAAQRESGRQATELIAKFKTECDAGKASSCALIPIMIRNCGYDIAGESNMWTRDNAIRLYG